MNFNLNTANKITVIRIVAIPIFLIIIYFNQYWSDTAAALIFAFVSLSDFLDGYIARKYNLVTDLGKVLDPIADKIFVTAAMIALCELGRLEGWIIIVMLARDFLISAVRDLSASKGIIIPAGIWGKIKTAVQMFAVGMITLKNEIFSINWLFLGHIFIYIALILSIYSGYIYIKQYLESNKGFIQ